MRPSHLLRAALPLALVCGPLMAQDTFDIHGYMRSGVGRNSNGGEQATFYMAGTGDSVTGGPGYRLGNETDNYLELAIDVKAFEKGGTAFKLHFRPAFRQYYSARDASSDAGGNVDGSMAANANQQIWIREAWGEATGIFGKDNPFADASIWMGRRFYQRHDMHLRDFWYWNNSGDGFGIENVNVGVGKFHYAYIQHDTGNVATNWSNNGTGNDWNPTGILNTNVYNINGKVIVGAHDFRLTDIPLWTNGSLSVGFQYNEAATRKSDPSLNSQRNPGRQFILEYVQGGLLGGDNKVFLTKGDGSTFYNWYNPNLSTKNNWWEAMDILYIAPVSWFGMQACAIYRVQDSPGGHPDGHGGWTDPEAGTGAFWSANHSTTTKWTSLGARPTFFLTKHFSIAAELGYDSWKFDGEAKARMLFKKTIALQWSPQAAFWSRPQLRLFVTKANWNKEANNWGDVAANVFGPGAQQGTTYGAQIEAWW